MWSKKAFRSKSYGTGVARLISARASLIATAILLALIVFVEPSLALLCLAGFLIVLIATFATSRSRNVRKLRQMVERRRQRTWPRNAMKSVVEALDMPVFIIDRQCVLRYANSASIDVFGTSITGQSVSFKFRSPQIVSLIEGVTRTQERDAVTYEENLGIKCWFRVECVPVPKVRKHDGKRLASQFFLLTFQDLTQARQSEEMRSDFVANASHELRTPLSSLRGYIETLQGSAKNDDAIREKFLTIMLGQAERMSRLIDDLLSLSNIEMKAHMPPRDNVDIGEVLSQVRHDLDDTARQFGAKLQFCDLSNPIEVTGDRDQLVQVFHNLIENACKYGGEAGIVKINVVQSDDPRSTLINVCDQGPGIAREHLPRVTERFYRGSSDPNIQGTGLGLAIVKHIIQRHNGDLNISSNVDGGTCVKIRLYN